MTTSDSSQNSALNRTSVATIAARLERLPMTAYQRMLFLIIATAWFFDSIDLGSLTFVLGSIRSEFGLSAAQTGLLSSMSFAGMFLGAAIAGIAADRYGRTLVFQVSMIFWGAGGLACGLASSVTALGAARALLGFGMGMEFPVAQSIVSEIIPARLRAISRLTRRVLAARLHCRRAPCSRGPAAGRLAVGLHHRGDPGPFRLCRPVPGTRISALARRPQPNGGCRGRDAEVRDRRVGATARWRSPGTAAPACRADGRRAIPFPGTLVRSIHPPDDDGVAALVLRVAGILRAHNVARRAPSAGRIFGDTVRLLHDVDLAGWACRAFLRRRS